MFPLKGNNVIIKQSSKYIITIFDRKKKKRQLFLSLQNLLCLPSRFYRSAAPSHLHPNLLFQDVATANRWCDRALYCTRHHRWFAGVSLPWTAFVDFPEFFTSVSVIGGAPSPEFSRRRLSGYDSVSLFFFWVLSPAFLPSRWFGKVLFLHFW
jgi:hypothetical protein